jgi:transposase
MFGTDLLLREALPGDFLAFLGAYGLSPDPCRPYLARTRGKVENP